MMGHDHMLGGAAAWTVPAVVLHPGPQVLVAGAGLAVVGALAPDIDHRQAMAAQFARSLGGVAVAAAVLTWLVSGTRSALVSAAAVGGLLVAALPWVTRPHHGGGYRGVIHSVWGLMLAAALAAGPCLVTPWPWWAAAALLAGWVSHLALDALTKEGLPFFWPWPIRFGWLPPQESILTGGRKRRRTAGRRPVEVWFAEEGERLLVRPALITAVVVSSALIVGGV